MADNKKSFKVKIDETETELAVVMPTPLQAQKAAVVYSRAFREAVTPADGKPGALVRAKLDSILREQNLWDDEKEAKYKELRKKLNEGELRLQSGGGKLSDGRKVALEMARARAEIREMTAERNRLDEITADAQAEQARFNYYVAACTVYKTGKPYFKDVDDFLSKEDDPVAAVAPVHLAKLLYGVEDDYEKKLPENKFLIDYKLVDDKLRLVDRSGKFVDEKWRQVDEHGRLVNEKGELIDADGNLLTEDGEYKVEFVPFEDDLAPAKA